MTNEEALKQAADRYGKEHTILPDYYNDGDIHDYEELTANAFKAGAEWMAGQGETVGTYVDLAKNDEEEFLAVLAGVETFKNGDKVIVQIRKVK